MDIFGVSDMWAWKCRMLFAGWSGLAGWWMWASRGEAWGMLFQGQKVYVMCRAGVV
jgi:hypothetical protein